MYVSMSTRRVFFFSRRTDLYACYICVFYSRRVYVSVVTFIVGVCVCLRFYGYVGVFTLDVCVCVCV